jgi:hypothetical protein
LTTGIKNIFVYLGTPPSYTCTAGVWHVSGDLLTPESLVDTSQLGGTFYDTWANALTQYGTLAVTSIQIVADGAWAVGGTQTVLVDNVMINGTTFTFESDVVDPSDKEECKNGGWEAFTASTGGPFKNQGDCVSFFATGGKNEGSGN